MLIPVRRIYREYFLYINCTPTDIFRHAVCYICSVRAKKSDIKLMIDRQKRNVCDIISVRLVKTDC